MKFVCDRCQTRYSIADEKVRQKILRIRCKSCGNVIVVQGEHLRGQTAADAHPAEPGRPSSSGNLKAASSSGSPTVPSSGPKPPPLPPRVPSSGPKPPPPPRLAKGPDRLGGHTEWYLAIDGEESGPYSRAEVAKRIHAVGRGKSVHVWKEGMATWKPPQEVSVVAHEMSLQRPSAPPSPRQPAAAIPTAPVSQADSEVTTTPLPLAGVARPRIAEAAPTEITTPEVSGFGEITTKKGKELAQSAATPTRDDFGEATTQKTKDLREMIGAPPASSYTEATTKKGKNLHELEASAPTAPGVDLGEPDRTPPPMKPLPPVGGKAASPVPPAARVPAVPMPDPVVAFETPRPVPAPRPSVPFAIRSAAVDSSPSAPFAVPGAAPGPLLPPGALPTPQPVSFAPFGGPTAEAAPSVLAPAQGRIAAVFQRQPGLKYVVAVLAIVGLIILLGLVILRGGERTTDSEPTGPAEPEPAKAEEPRPAVAETPPPPPPPPAPAAAPAPQENPAPVAHASGKPSSRSSGRSGRHAARTTQRAAPERAAPERQEPARPAKDKGAAPPRLADARPNPFDESRSVSQAQITAVVRNPANQAGLKSCYERALKMDNHLTSGRIDVTVSIAASGAVQRVVINAPSSFILVEPCIKSAVKRWSFPPNTEDYGTNFPLIMQGGM